MSNLCTPHIFIKCGNYFAKDHKVRISTTVLKKKLPVRKTYFSNEKSWSLSSFQVDSWFLNTDNSYIIIFFLLLLNSKIS